jgi:hypothetical protein
LATSTASSCAAVSAFFPGKFADVLHGCAALPCSAYGASTASNLPSKDRTSGNSAPLRARFDTRPQHGSSRGLVGLCPRTTRCHRRSLHSSRKPEMERERSVEETCRIRTVTADRRRQDKSRKVRPVGRLGFACNFKHASNIVKTRHDLLTSPSRCSCSAFHTLRGHDEGKRRFHVRPGRIPSTRAPETKSFLAQALTSTQKAGSIRSGRAGSGGRFGRRRADKGTTARHRSCGHRRFPLICGAADLHAQT